LHIEPNLDEAEGERPNFVDFLVGGEAGSGVDEDRDRIEEDAATLFSRGSVRSRKEIFAVDVAKRYKLFTSRKKIETFDFPFDLLTKVLKA
jgi:hypothetical protein